MKQLITPVFANVGDNINTSYSESALIVSCYVSLRQVKVRPVTREVVALYVVEEITMELVVTLPVNHPLGPISVECGRRVGVANTQWRNWMLQMVTFLSHQVGLSSD